MMAPFDIIAWVGGVLLAVCAVPQAIKCFIEKNARGVSTWMLILWGLGELALCIYTTHTQQWALVFNYGTNLGIILVITYYKVWPKNG